MEPIRVMLVDDAADARTLVRLILDEHEDLAVVAEAVGAEAALEQLPGARPDVALLDARMPLMDGFELARSLLAQDARLRVAILSSMVDATTEAQARAVGAHRCVSKADLDGLPDLVRELRNGQL